MNTDGSPFYNIFLDMVNAIYQQQNSFYNSGNILHVNNNDQQNHSIVSCLNNYFVGQTLLFRNLLIEHAFDELILEVILNIPEQGNKKINLKIYDYIKGDIMDIKKSSLVGDVICSICIEQIGRDQIYNSIPYCGHEFHHNCLLQATEFSVTCPNCRKPYDEFIEKLLKMENN